MGTGKKVAIGCLGIFILIVAVGGVSLYMFLIKPVLGGLETLEEIHQANTKIENQAPYQPPPGGELESEQVERFVSAQREISTGLEPILSELKEKHEALDDDWREGDISIFEARGVLEEMLNLYAEAKNIQVAALNRQDFSLQEYRFVRQAFYRGLGAGLFPYNVDVMAETASKRELDMDLDKFETQKEEFSQEALEKNRELAAEYAGEAEEWLIFAWFGI